MSNAVSVVTAISLLAEPAPALKSLQSMLVTALPECNDLVGGFVPQVSQPRPS